MTHSRPVALVTGASSGIGAAAAAALVEAGFDVVGTSRNTAGVTAPDGVTFLALDVASDESVAALVDQVIARFASSRDDGGAPLRRAPSNRLSACSM